MTKTLCNQRDTIPPPVNHIVHYLALSNCNEANIFSSDLAQTFTPHIVTNQPTLHEDYVIFGLFFKFTGNN